MDLTTYVMVMGAFLALMAFCAGDRGMIKARLRIRLNRPRKSGNQAGEELD